ncbi:ABC transporter permease [Paenibacillus taichungensis]|uniref:YhgE/Pip domain-containing protein n=1 Tax=Paenibacillus taichungensis TaxID=484184 RepID=UPI0038CFBA7B
MFKNKMVLMSPIIALVIIFVFSLTLFPSVQPKPDSLPVAIVNEDQGVQIPNQPQMNMGQKIVEMIQKSSSSGDDTEPAVKWESVNSLEEVQQGLDLQKYYAALVIPQDFSSKQASLMTSAPSSPEIQILINQGMNMAASTLSGQILNGVVDNINNTVRTQLLEELKAKGTTLTVEQVAFLVNPIAKDVTNVNEVGTHSANGNSPISLFQPLWMASLASSALIYTAVKKVPVTTRKGRLSVKAGQILTGAVIAVVVGFGFTWIADRIVGLQITNFTDTALFLSISSFSFFLMISAVISLLGLGGIAIFGLMLFFGAPLLALAPEMMSSFYREWVYPWLPMRFMIEGLRGIFFFDHGLSWSSPLSALVWIGLAGMLIILGTAFIPQRHKESRNEMMST